MDISSEKKLLRKEVRAMERSLAPEYKLRADRAIARFLYDLPEYRKARTVFAFVGMKREIDTRPFLMRVLWDGKTLCVPLCTGDGIMELKLIRSLDELRPGAYGILEPAVDAPAVDPSEVDLAVIPCVSCSLRGERLGQGGGFYDRFLQSFKGSSVLVCREVLMREDIPMEPHDAVIPIVISEKGVFRGGRPARC